MNKIYKIVRSRTTGLTVVASEFAKGAKKGSKQKLALLTLLSVFSAQSVSAISIPQDYNPGNNSNQNGSINVSGSGQEIDLGLNSGFANAKPGVEVQEHTIVSTESVNSLYQTKYVDVTNATNNFNQVKSDYDKGLASDADLQNAQNSLTNAQNKADLISDDKFKVSDPDNLIGKNTEGTAISEKTAKYKDPVTDKSFAITVKNDLVQTEAGSSISTDGISVSFYEKVGSDQQYSNMEMVSVTGNNTDVTVVNNTPGTGGTNDQLVAISKDGSGVISVQDGANLTFDTTVSYYTGNKESTSTTFDEKDKYSANSDVHLYEVQYKGTVDTVLGQKTINSAEDFNAFNKELINYIQTDEQLRLEYSTAEDMQAFYDSQIDGLYALKPIGSYQIEFSITPEELAQLAKDQGLENEFNNKVTKADKDTDVGLQSTKDNHFIGVGGSGSEITITENAVIDNSATDANGVKNVSSGAVIRADFVDSGLTANNIFNVDGKIDAHGGDAILANNAEIYVSETGFIDGNVKANGQGLNGDNVVDNKGTITGTVTLENGHINNYSGAALGSIIGGDNVAIVNEIGGQIGDAKSDSTNINIGANGNINNSGTINGSVNSGINSNITNQASGSINGVVTVVGSGSTFTNDGTVSGIKTSNGAQVVNNNLIIGENDDESNSNSFMTLNNGAGMTNNGNIYIGYSKQDGSNAIQASTVNQQKYTAIAVSGLGTQLINNKNIYLSATQQNVNVVSVSNHGEYHDTANSVIILNNEKQAITNVDKDTGNDNKAVYISGADANAVINGLVELNDVGSTALWVQDGGALTLNGTINLNSQNILDAGGDASKDKQVRSVGAWIQGDGSTFVMDGNAQINMNADRAIGVHIRDGATAQINDHAAINFSDKKNQVGFLISGISKEAAIEYNSDSELKLNGEGSVLFRVERGSVFNSDTISSNNTSLSVLDSNNTKNSTLMVITNGPTGAGLNNQTHANLSGFTLKVNGENAKGVSVEGGAQVEITDNTKIELTGDNSILASIDGWYYDINGVNSTKDNGSSYLKSSANLTTDISVGNGQVVTGKNSVGYYITHGGTLSHQGSIDFQQPSKNNIGVKIDSGGILQSELGSSIKVQGTAIEISGSSSIATINNVGNGNSPVVWAIGSDENTNDAAYHVKDQAKLNLTGAGITKAQGTAHGILVDGASQIILNGAMLDLYSNGTLDSSSGNGIENRSALSNIQFINNATINVKDGYGIHSSVSFAQNSKTSGIINVYGDGTGIRFESIDASNGDILGTTDNAINNTNYENVIVNVYENSGHGIYVDSSKTVNTSTSVNIISSTGQSALEIKGTTESASQSGKLHSANHNSPIVDLNNGHINQFTNNGELLLGSFASDGTFTESTKDAAKNSYVIKTEANENSMTFTNESNGKINGVVELLGYGDKTDPDNTSKGNTVILKGEGNVFKTGQGDDTFIVKTVIGDDLGGDNQAKQFTQIDGGGGHNTITFDTKSDFTINKDNTIVNIDHFALDNASKVTLNNLTTIDGLNTNVATYDIKDNKSVLTYRWDNSNTNFDRVLTGKGTFKVDMQSLDTNGKPINEFAFDNTTNTGSFAGTLELTNTNYVLADSTDHKNTAALTQATLKVSDNSYVKVGAGNQEISGLTVNGGTVDFGRVDMADDQSENHISVDNLVLDKGQIKIDSSGSIYNPSIPSSLPLLEQDSGIIFTQLVSANNVSGGAINIDIDRSQIKLVDENGNEISDSAQSDLIQNGELVARATYDTRLTKGENSDGLYLGYGLTQVELNTKNDNGNALILDATNSDPLKPSSSDFDVLITNYDNGDGTFNYGDLQIRGTKAVTLSGSNSYHGSTYIKDTSTLISGANDALGFTRLLKLDANTKFDLNGWNQSVGSLYTSADSMVNLNGGELTISGEDRTDAVEALDSSYLAAGTLSGSGKLIIGDSTLTRADTSLASITVLGDNSALTADVLNAVNGQINMDSQGGLGSGELVNNGELNLYFAQDSVLTNQALLGNGTINKYNANALTFTLDQAKDFSGETNIKGGTIIFKGDNNATTNSYASHDVNIAPSGTLVGIDNVIFQGNVNNSGQFYVGNLPGGADFKADEPSHVTINGNYNGAEGSHLYFNGKLSDDDSAVNKLNIGGDSSGTSYVSVNNIGGLGAQTVNGIEIINVAGQSDANFVQSGRVIVGAFDYKLQRSATNSNNWVLASNLTTRPEIGGYLGNIFAANNMFNLRLHDRLGETQYTDLMTGEQKVTSMWMRHQYGYDKYSAANGDLSIKNNWNITQLGGDIAGWSSNDLNRLHVGLMVGYGRSKNKSTSNIYSAKSDATVDGYSYGLYATWYDNNEDKTGLYIDTWALWNNFNASISGDDVSEKYRLKGLTASIESGYSIVTGTWGHYDVWLQPKGQLIWGGVKAKDRTESNGTRVSSDDGNLQTRLGVRASLLSNEQTKQTTNQTAQLFMEANWLHNTKLYDVTLNDELTVGQDSARNIGELKVGVEGNINQNTNIWFNLAGQRGDHDFKNASIMLGLKYSF